MQTFWFLAYFPEPLSLAAQTLLARDKGQPTQAAYWAWLLLRSVPGCCCVVCLLLLPWRREPSLGFRAGGIQAGLCRLCRAFWCVVRWQLFTRCDACPADMQGWNGAGSGPSSSCGSRLYLGRCAVHLGCSSAGGGSSAGSGCNAGCGNLLRWGMRLATGMQCVHSCLLCTRGCSLTDCSLTAASPA